MRTGTTDRRLGQFWVERPSAARAAVQRIQAVLSAAGVRTSMAEVVSMAITRLEPQAALEMFKDKISGGHR